ncbi:MAG TPA: copper ABC transporter ATP-binding protein [Nitrospiraceae bacterium]|nr:copper ABC transporter ATP-binding protein [Nitrospiraceae bacterium]
MIMKLDGVSKAFREVMAVHSVSLQLKEGQSLGLVGPNGSGKSTLLKILLGIMRPTGGRVLINDEELTEKGWKDFRRRLGYMPERVSFYDNLTGKETLHLFARIKGTSVGSIGKIINRLLPEEALRRRVGGYSKGMRQRLNLAQALLSDPDLLILDEPTSGLDPMGTREFYDILDEVKGRKKLTVILSSHILAEIEDKTDVVAVMINGSLRAIGSLQQLYTGLNLPFWITITLKKKDETLEELLRREGAADLDYKNGYLLASIPREHKMKAISAVMKEKDRFVDFSIREPSLEEVFFGVH